MLFFQYPITVCFFVCSHDLDTGPTDFRKTFTGYKGHQTKKIEPKNWGSPLSFGSWFCGVIIIHSIWESKHLYEKCLFWVMYVYGLYESPILSTGFSGFLGFLPRIEGFLQGFGICRVFMIAEEPMDEVLGCWYSIGFHNRTKGLS